MFGLLSLSPTIVSDFSSVASIRERKRQGGLRVLEIMFRKIRLPLKAALAAIPCAVSKRSASYPVNSR
jgi:hypothetical protein